MARDDDRRPQAPAQPPANRPQDRDRGGFWGAAGNTGGRPQATPPQASRPPQRQERQDPRRGREWPVAGQDDRQERPLPQPERGNGGDGRRRGWGNLID
ncbi:hypothetical protein D0B54_14115 [Solimonas sp. K1W22B-7]|nr:hypothetical protein D0B54_14115 [Solimonas sp. K1W22B-7]